MSEETIQQKRAEFLTRLASLMEEFDVTIDIEDISTGWEGGTPKVIIGHWTWADPVSFWGAISISANDIRKSINSSDNRKQK